MSSIEIDSLRPEAPARAPMGPDGTASDGRSDPGREAVGLVSRVEDAVARAPAAVSAAADGVDIRREPGYDPAELFFDPADPLARAKAAGNLARKALGLRYAMSTVPLDPSCVRGTHGRLPDSASDTPLLLSSDPSFLDGAADRVPAIDVRDLVLRHQGLDERMPQTATRDRVAPR